MDITGNTLEHCDTNSGEGHYPKWPNQSPKSSHNSTEAIMPTPPPNDNKCRRIAFQLGIFILTFLNYGVLHATRSSWSMATKDLLDYYGWSENTVSDMNATFLFTYSLGGFFLSHLGDIYSKRKLICFMYSIIALTELALGCLQFISVEN